jgi:16S rRNA (cytidine1402-2'-O)-methyltransferase
MESKGILYLVATPIGNLEDITLRALRMLKEVDLIGAEDTRNSRKLLSYYQINTPLTSYHDHNQETKGRQLIDRLLGGKNVALISDAGMPGISDPGSLLVKQALAAGITVVPVPGANAALAALVASGINTDRFLFHGFLPRRKKEREEQLLFLKEESRTVIIYEAPHRLVATLKSLANCWHGGQVAVARELTKKFEEFVRGTAQEILDHFLTTPPKGEITMVLEGNREKSQDTAISMAKQPLSLIQSKEQVNPVEQVMELVKQGCHKKAAIKEVSSLLNINKRVLYQLVLETEGKIKS